MDKRGVTLLELMIVVAIVGILAAVAIPAYDGYVTRSRRSNAFTALETVRAAQEMYRAEHGFYAGGLNPHLAGCGPNMAGDNYTISLTRTDNTHYTATSTPQNKQTGDFYFQIDQDGTQWYDADGTPPWTQGRWEDLR
ncbi:MAG: prepilin-type N-terminal cleavage/methylation domain-containing protein [Deltaproteobacteria bacterium]|nr:prepilin-type N-terminal cleavage/methylation domain-containing protein [Deltaproteobacteria bacterium]